MAEGLDFSLPEKKNKGGFNAGGIIILVVVLILTAVNLWFILGMKQSGIIGGASDKTAEQFKELAGKLEARNLHTQAARAWQQYYENANLNAPEKAQTLFRIGDELLKGDEPEEAISYFYRSELAARVPELRRKINLRIKEAFEQAGEFAALRYEIMARTTDEPSETGEEIVAEIGPRTISMAELDEMIGREIDLQLQQMAAFLPPEQYMARKKAMTEQLSQPQRRRQFLQSQMMEEALQREALTQELDENTSVKAQIRKNRRQILAQALLNKDIAGKITITESDLENYYNAHQSEYLTPPEAQIRHAAFENEAAAMNAVEKLKNGEEIGTRQTIGQGREVPGLSENAEITAKLFAGETGEVLGPVEENGLWHVIKIVQHNEARQQSLDEVQNQIYSTVYSQKQLELQQELTRELMNKYDIVIHQEAFEIDEEN